MAKQKEKTMLQINDADNTKLSSTVREEPVYERVVMGGGKSETLVIFATEIVRSEIGRRWNAVGAGNLSNESVTVTLLGWGEFTAILLEEIECWAESSGTRRGAELIAVVIPSR